MLASELKNIARDLVSEQNKWKLLQLLNQARHILSIREQLGENGYQKEAGNIRSLVSVMKRENIFNSYPRDILQDLKSSAVSSLLPERIADLLLAMLPAQDMTRASASSELNIYIENANEILSQASRVIDFSNALEIKDYSISEGKNAVRLLLPRHSFDNSFHKLSPTLKPFDRLFLGVCELYTGQRKSPEIVYASTTDLSFLLEWLPQAVGGLLLLYTPLMEAAEKTLNVIRAAKDLYGVGANDEIVKELEEKLKKTNEETIKASIDEHLSSIKSAVDEGRTSELKNEIKIYALVVSNEIAKGARFSFGSEDNLINLPDILLSSDDQDEVQRMIERQRAIESRLDMLLSSVGHKSVLLQAPIKDNEAIEVSAKHEDVRSE